MPNPVLTLSSKQKKALAAIDERNLEMVSNAYLSLYSDIEGDIDALILAIGALTNPTAAQIRGLPQYKRLMRNAENELDDFTAFTKQTISAVGLAAIGYGLADSAAIIKAYGLEFTGLTPSAMRPLLKYLDKGGALYGRLSELTGATIDAVISAIIDGVGQGFNPRKIASMIQDAFGRGLTDALRNVRTVQLYAYRDSAIANYKTEDFVAGWIWYAELDADVCASCVALHGTIHSLDEKLNDHYNGRCAAIAYIPEFGNPVEQTGEEWLKSLPEEQQRRILGAGKHDAWKAGKFEFGKLSKEYDNEVYGKMRSETPLKDLLGE